MKLGHSNADIAPDWTPWNDATLRKNGPKVERPEIPTPKEKDPTVIILSCGSLLLEVTNNRRTATDDGDVVRRVFPSTITHHIEKWL
jgi:hypothetical protein